MLELINLPNGACLEAKLDFPRSRGQQSKLAVCLHPWSWLGGRMDDPVLLSLLEPLENLGYYTLRFNSRGVGKSAGRASLTGFTEGKDLEFLVQWAIDKVGDVGSLVLIGYSHGSLIASLHPVLPTIKTSHVLISYPLGPRGWLTLFNSGTYTAKLREVVETAKSNVLVLYGSEDEFTGASRYKAWARDLEQISQGHLKVVEVDGSHFWRGQQGRRLTGAFLEWLS
ncbi:Alpha/Beta hydrolase protein [Collybia nuda]|uniref:Alpha/Beta hydrolase protein n=1 Tax=Collybia nuda TaxID=64659 RepID=A0A9P5YAV0_9AGAR|nr:Alpha/Beta hydrolase protein [Collybia nuda]